MQETPKVPQTGCSMNVMDAIRARHSVRDFSPQIIDKAVIHALLDAAVLAPTAVHEEPCAFAIIQDKKLLNRLSNSAKDLLARGTDPIHPHGGKFAYDRFTHKEFNAFYNANTLVVICGKPMGPFVAADCWLAAENMLLFAHCQ